MSLKSLKKEVEKKGGHIIRMSIYERGPDATDPIITNGRVELMKKEPGPLLPIYNLNDLCNAIKEIATAKWADMQIQPVVKFWEVLEENRLDLEEWIRKSFPDKAQGIDQVKKGLKFFYTTMRETEKGDIYVSDDYTLAEKSLLDEYGISFRWVAQLYSGIFNFGHTWNMIFTDFHDKVKNLDSILKNYIVQQLKSVQDQIKEIEDSSQFHSIFMGAIHSKFEDLIKLLIHMGYYDSLLGKAIIARLIDIESDPLYEELSEIVEANEEKRRFREKEQELENFRQLGKELLGKEIENIEKTEDLQKGKPISVLIDELFEKFKKWESDELVEKKP